MERGEIHWVDFGPPVDNRQAGKRPAIILQNNALNRNPRYILTIVLPLTSRGSKGPSYAEIQPDGRNGLTMTSWSIGNQPTIAAKRQVIGFIGDLAPHDLERVFRGLDLALGRL
ncbi:hypothetical protein BH11ARM2_BH11ARM2_03480 [soil metagenome]